MQLCNVCAGPATQDPFYYDWRGKKWWIYRCSECTHQFVFPHLSAVELNEVFRDEYFDRDGDWSCGVWQMDGAAASYEEAEAYLREEAREVLAQLPSSRERLLVDVGCAGGVFLDEARLAGWSPMGFELNAKMRDEARKRGFRVEADASHAYYRDYLMHAADVVTMMDTLEHIPNPRAVMENVRHWLKPGGTLLIRGPLSNDARADVKERLRRLVGKPKRLPGYPLDANCFNPRSLTRLLREFDLQPTAWHGVIKGFGTVVAKKAEQGLWAPVFQRLALDAERYVHTEGYGV